MEITMGTYESGLIKLFLAWMTKSNQWHPVKMIQQPFSLLFFSLLLFFINTSSLVDVVRVDHHSEKAA